MLPWITSPPNVIFIQPHGFLEDSYMPLPIKDIDWVEVNYSNRGDYGANIVLVYLKDYDYEETKKSYNTKIINKPWFNQLLPDKAYIHWDDTIEIIINERVNVDIITEDEAEDIIDNVQSLTMMQQVPCSL